MTVKQITLFLILPVSVVFSGFQPLKAQFEQYVLGARPVSLGGSGIVLENDPWAAFINPALYATFESINASAAYVPARFALSELQSSAASVIFPFSKFSSALAVHKFGYELYSETTVSLSGAYNIGTRLSIGSSINWHHLSIERYGNASVFGINAGVHAGITEKLSTGFSVSNINRPTIGQAKNSLPQIIRAGIMYRPHPLLNITAELEKDILFEPEFRFGAEYIIAESFYIRAGMNDRPARASGGFSIIHKSIQLDYALQWHFELGQSHFITLIFRLPGRQSRVIPEPVIIQTQINIRPELVIEQRLLHSDLQPRIQDPVTESLLRFINTANESDLLVLPRIGHVIAQRIVTYRNEHGAFPTIQDLQNVPGIGERTIENLLDFWRNRIRSDND